MKIIGTNSIPFIRRRPVRMGNQPLERQQTTGLDTAGKPSLQSAKLGQLYERFSQSPAGGLHQFITERLSPSFDMSDPQFSKPQLKLLLDDVQARYGLHLHGQGLVMLKLDPVSRALATPTKTREIKEALDKPEIQKVLCYFWPRQQLKALDALVEDTREFSGFAKAFSSPIFQAAVERAKNPNDMYHRLFFQPRVTSNGTDPALINSFQKLYTLLRPTLQTDWLQKRHRWIGSWDISPQISSSLHFPPQEAFRPDFHALFSEAKADPETQEHLLQLAAGRDPRNSIRFTTTTNRYRHQGGRDIIRFLNQHEPSGKKAAQLVDLMMESLPFKTDEEQQHFRQTLQRFLTLGSQWILLNPNVQASRKMRDITILMDNVNRQSEFKSAWQKMQRRYPLFPSVKMGV